MILKLNRFLRKIVLVLGAICIIFKLMDKKTCQKKVQHEGFQTQEFDDIW